MPYKAVHLWRAPILDHQTNEEQIHQTFRLSLNCCTTDLHSYFSPPSNTSFESRYRGNDKIHRLGRHLIVIDQGLHHTKLCSSLCFCGLPVVNWRKSWLQTKSFFWWTVICIWSKGLNLDLVDPTEGPAFASKIIVMFTNTILKSLLVEHEDTIDYFSGSIYIQPACKGLNLPVYARMQWAIVLWGRPFHTHC